MMHLISKDDKDTNHKRSFIYNFSETKYCTKWICSYPRHGFFYPLSLSLSFSLSVTKFEDTETEM